MKYSSLPVLFIMILISGCDRQESSYGDEWSFTIENTGGDCDMPAPADYDELTEIAHMPDPFLSVDGTRISRSDDWRCRRAEISALAQHYELGPKPPAPEMVTSTLHGDTLTVTVEENGVTISFDAVINFPSGGEAPYPAMIGIGNSWLNNADLDSLGVAVIRFPNNDLGQQSGGSSRGQGKFFDIYGSDHRASAMMAWAWGVSRLIDGLETTSGLQIHSGRLGVTGCSRNGKGALIAGAFDERIALTIPQESGSGGSAGWRISDTQLERGENVQTLRQIVNENVWFADDFRIFSESAAKLPFDHHSVMGLVAPRALLVIEHGGIEWLGNESTYTTSVIAREIWTAMGIEDRMGVSQVSGHNHCQFPDSQRPEVNAFVKKFLLDDPDIDTQIVRTDADIQPDLARWAPWETPDLQ